MTKNNIKISKLICAEDLKFTLAKKENISKVT